MPAIKSVASLRAAKATKPVYYNIHLNGHAGRKRGSRITLHSRAFACEYACVLSKGEDNDTRDKKRVPRRSNIDKDNDDEDDDENDETVFPQASSTAMSAA